MVPNEAWSASITPRAAISSRTTAPKVRREPTRALKTYRDGSVTTSVRKNSAGTFTAAAIIWSQPM